MTNLSTLYNAPASLANSIVDGDLTHAPDGNSVYDALALKPTFNSVFNGRLINMTDYHIPYKLSGEPDIGMLSSGMSSDGSNTTIINGNLIIGTAGKGISFAATADAGGMTGELFDDYELGTWTPRLAFNGVTTGITYSTNYQSGFYEKIGKMVHINAIMILTSKGAATGAATIIDFPYTNKNSISAYSVPSFCYALVTVADYSTGYTGVNTNTMALKETTNAGATTDLTNADFSDTSWIMFSLTYRAE